MGVPFSLRTLPDDPKSSEQALLLEVSITFHWLWTRPLSAYRITGLWRHLRFKLQSS